VRLLTSTSPREGGAREEKPFRLSRFAVAAAFARSGRRAAAGGAGGREELQFQSTWPASLTLQDNFKMFAERVDKLTGGQVKIEALAAGSIVPPFEILDARTRE